MPSFLIQTLGCKLNQLESEAITGAFEKAGFKEAVRGFTQINADEYSDSPSVIIINTCTVTSKADQKARRVIRKALRDYPDSNVIVTGCYAQLNRDDLEKLDDENPKRLSVIGKDEILRFINKINPCKSASIRGPIEFTPIEKSAKTSGQFEFNPQRFSEHTRSLLKIQDGCGNTCTYCKIRLARGSSISLESDEVLSRLKILEQNHAEAVLTGVNICQYSSNNGDTNINLTGLLEYLLSGTEKINLRLSSLTPDFIDKNLVNVLANKRIRPHFHLSIQSGSKKILERMGRSYDSKIIEKSISLLRSVKDDPFLACDIITGFPGETETEFKETYNMCKKLDFAWIHVFPYSKRPGTEAFLFTDTVHESEVTKRVQLFTDLAKQGRADYIRCWLGRDVDVLTEKPAKNSCCGVTENYLKVQIKCKDKIPLPGTVLRCKLTEAKNSEKIDALAEQSF
ncbi:MAG: tRNA (N(6)-L-threonylcarbamoyladenosine(37)-C(2))-methylthiotransferase MtaB [Treponema sp.]|nr:tRNA (N(6)-L-threonylcarbamoyladenosine(37)-C(2))-methylthiotransferase MtaB [Treponema sp.]